MSTSPPRFSTTFDTPAAASTGRDGWRLFPTCGERTVHPEADGPNHTSTLVNRPFRRLLSDSRLTAPPDRAHPARGGGKEPAPAPTARRLRGRHDTGAETPGGSALSEEKAGPAAKETSRGRKGRHPGDRPDKPAEGGGRKRLPSRRERNPGGGKTQGRIGSPRRLIPSRRATDFRGDQDRAAGRGLAGNRHTV